MGISGIYFKLKKDDGELIEFSDKSLYELIEDNPEAVESFNKYYSKKYRTMKEYERYYTNMFKVLKGYDPQAVEYK